jgi:hypothetical protein
VATSTELTGSAARNTNPVSTVPAMAPTVPMPDSRPTTLPVSARSVSTSFVTIGGHGREQGPRHEDRHDRHEQRRSRPSGLTGGPNEERGRGHSHPRDRKQRAECPTRRHDVGGPAPGPRPGGDRGQRDADDDRARLEGEAEVGGKQAQRRELDDEHGCTRAEHQCSRRHRPQPTHRFRGCAWGFRHGDQCACPVGHSDGSTRSPSSTSVTRLCGRALGLASGNDVITRRPRAAPERRRSG